MTEATFSTETSVHSRATRRNIPENSILHSHRRENLKSYIHKICITNCVKMKSMTCVKFV
jgi:hypothetical protein